MNSFTAIDFETANSELLIAAFYLIIINLIAFVLYGVDKKRSIRNEHRIRESALLWIARLGGAIGSWLGLKLFRHKTSIQSSSIIITTIRH